MRHSSAALQYVVWVRLPLAVPIEQTVLINAVATGAFPAFLECIINIYDGFTLPQTSWGEKYNLQLRDVSRYSCLFVVREGLLTEEEI